MSPWPRRSRMADLRLSSTSFQMAARFARYELIEDDETCYGEESELQGMWATGKEEWLDECSV